MEKLRWKILSVIGLIILFFGIFGNAAVLTDHTLGPEVLNVGYLVMGIGFAVFGFGVYRIIKINIMISTIPPIKVLRADEQVLETWRYRVSTGFLRWDNEVAALTNSRILIGDAKTQMMTREWDLSEIDIVATNRKNYSSYSHSFFHTTSQNTGGAASSWGRSSGSSSGVSKTLGDLEFIKKGRIVFSISNVADPDGIVSRIRAIKDDIIN